MPAKKPVKKTVKKKTTRKTAKTAKPKTKEVKARDIGVDVKAPAEACDDVNCPFHGSLPVRGQMIKGKVVSSKMDKTVVVTHQHMRKVPKFERFEKRSGRYMAHNPPCIGAKAGDEVTIMECRPLSKGKSYVVIEGGAGK